MSLPLLPWFLAFFAGTLLADLQAESVFPLVLALGAILTAVGLQLRGRRRSPFAKLVALVLLFAAGWGNVTLRETPLPSDHIWNHLQHEKRARVEGVIVNRPERSVDRTRLLISLKKINYRDGWVPVSGIALITLYGDPVDLDWGDRVRFPYIRLRRPLNFRNPGRFDFERFMQSEGIDVAGGTSRRNRLEVLGREALPAWDAVTFTLRDKVAGLLEQGLPDEQRAMVSGLVFGEKQSLPKEVLEAYQATGMGHLLAVSGLHIGFVALIFFWAGNRLLFQLMWRFKPAWAQYGYARKGAALLALFAVLFYMLLVGAKVSSIRAGILVMAVLLALWVNRERQILNTLILAAFCILLWDPGAVYKLGFQLSFSAVLAIVLVLKWIAEPTEDPLEKMGELPWYRRWSVNDVPTVGWQNKLVDVLVASAFISVAAYIGTLPILLFQFHRISLVAPFLNILLVPLASFLIPGCLVVLFLGMLVPMIAVFLLPVLGWLAALFLHLPVWIAALPQASVYLAASSFVWIVCYVIFFAGSAYRFYLCRRVTEQNPLPAFWKRYASWGLGTAGLVIVAGLVAPRLFHAKDECLHVWLLDVGQGESVFIEFPNGDNLLLDGGGFFKGSLDVGVRVVGSFLWSRGIGYIDYLGATHSDQDHIDGVESVLQNMQVAHFLNRRDGMGDRRFTKLVSQAVVRGVSLVEFSPDKPLRVGDVMLENLHPTDAFNRNVLEKASGRLNNDQSWVVRLTYGEFRLLLTGDISDKSERWLIKRGVDLKASVLKSPHHGSKTSSSQEFLDAVGAQDILISSGFANYFHHPHTSVLERYQRIGARVWNTGQHGALHLITDGKTYEIETHGHLSHWNRKKDDPLP